MANDGATQLGMTPQFYPGEPKALRDSGGIPTLGLSADQVLKRLQPSVALFQRLFGQQEVHGRNEARPKTRLGIQIASCRFPGDERPSSWILGCLLNWMISSRTVSLASRSFAVWFARCSGDQHSSAARRRRGSYILRRRPDCLAGHVGLEPANIILKNAL